MSKKKACKNCALITEEETCPSCGSNNFANTIVGRMIILDTEKSHVAKIIAAKKEGEYAIKMR